MSSYVSPPPMRSHKFMRKNSSLNRPFISERFDLLLVDTISILASAGIYCDLYPSPLDALDMTTLLNFAMSDSETLLYVLPT